MTEGVIVYKALQAAIVAVSIGFASGPTVAVAGPMQLHSHPTAAPISVQVITVRATRVGTTDPNLRAMEKQMHNLGFRGFRLAHVGKERVSNSSSQRFELTKRYATHVRLIGKTSSHAKLRVRVMKDGELHHKVDLTLPKNQSHITVVKPEDGSAAIVTVITPKF